MDETKINMSPSFAQGQAEHRAVAAAITVITNFNNNYEAAATINNEREDSTNLS